MEAIPHEGALFFDFACRVHQEPQWLGTSYATSLVSPHNFVDFQVSQAGIGIRVDSPLVGIRDFPASRQLLKLVCHQESSKFPATLRWRYRVYLMGTSV
jgi:hypothetical protein